MPEQRSRPVVAHRAANNDRGGMRGTREALLNRFIRVCKQASRLRRLDLQAGERDVFRR